MVTGGASGLGRGTVNTLLNAGAKIAIVDLPTSKGAEIAEELGENVIFAPANVGLTPKELLCIKLIFVRFHWGEKY